MPLAILPISHGSRRAVANANLVHLAELSAIAVPRRSSRLPTSNSPSRRSRKELLGASSAGRGTCRAAS